MDQKKTMPQGAKIAVTILNIALILAGIVTMLVLTIGTMGAKADGTFGLFGRSYHLNQSEQMSPLIEKNDLITVREAAPTHFRMGDLIAYYQADGGKDYLIIRKLVGMVGSEYYLEDGDGVQTIVDAGTTRFLGTVEARSPKLGVAVQFLQSKEGRKIYLWWTVSLLFLLMGVITLLHVIMKNAGRQESDEDEDYGVEYLEAEQDLTREPHTEIAEEPVDDGDFYVDVSAFADIEEPVQEEPVSDPVPAAEPEKPQAADAVEEPAAEAVAAPLAEETEEEFDLQKIISDIQAKLDSEEKE